MRPLNAEKLIKILKENGFILSRQKGSHMIFKNPQNSAIVPTLNYETLSWRNFLNRRVKIC